ncbi:hypothetical protein [Nocardia macrotermitis]|uniref:Uncharacterized protein n=1 Tax=Nocardia macrotermitis TaxID=2585198 RepID=A0A7K0CXD5_9NOCA|nr:hypothetical protein [Nocardia macrotermitis]MQY18088.1 hypothetical protein [Nocardia macrotermitis]
MVESFVWEHAGDEEFILAKKVGRVSLFVELNLDSDEIARARDLFAQVVHGHERTAGFARIVQRFPALTLTTLIGHAGLAYEQGRYWESFWSELDLARDADFEQLLRTELGTLLRRFGLREFPELGHQYVQVMAVHAGIPVHCLGDLVDVIEQHIAHGRDPSGAALFEWLTEPGMGYRLNQLDVPVRNFLRFGGEVAVDIVDRIIEFAGYMREHPDAANDLGLDSSTTGLPDVLLDALIDRLTERPFGSYAVASNPAARAHRPTVAYSRIDDEIVVEVPYPARSPEVPWLVSFDGDVREVYAERAWGFSDDEAQPTTAVPVPRRVRQIVLTHPPSGAEHRISLVDKDNPLLVFDERGHLLARRMALPRGEVVVVHPHDATLLDAYREVPIIAVEQAVPTGWRDWRARVCDLDDVDGIRLERKGQLGPIQQVRPVGAPRLDLGEPIPGVTTCTGLAVYAERPTVLLPRGTAEATCWRIRTRRARTTDWLTDQEREAGAESTELGPFDGVPEGLLGWFDIVVSGAPGSDLRHSVFLAEGLLVDHSERVRTPVGEGLSSITTELAGLGPLIPDRDVIEFDTGMRQTEIRVCSGERSERLVLCPPLIELRVDRHDAAARWQTTPVLLSADDLADHAHAAVRVSGEVEVDVVLADAAGRIVQTEMPQVLRGNVFRVSIRSFLDTARSLRTARLLARIDLPDGTTREVPLVLIRPPHLCTGVRVDGSALIFDGVAGAELGAFIWANSAPWRGPSQVTIDAGRAELPPEFVAGGPLTVQVFVDDPWASITVPSAPDATAIRVDQPGWMPDPEPDRTQLSRFLSGHGELPSGGGVFADMWTVLAGLPADAERIRPAVAHALVSDARSALEALGQSTIAQHEHPALLVRTGLAESDFASVVRHGFHSNPWLGCLIDIADLPLIALRTGMDEVRAELRGYLADQGGPALLELLSGKFANPRVGIFDASAEWMNNVDDDQRIRAIKDSCEIVPGALLDEGMRQAAMFEAFAQRFAWQHDPALMRLTTGSWELLAALRRVSAPGYDAVLARNEELSGIDTTELPWMLMSMQSLLMAMVARLAARRRFRISPISESMRSAWARLAELCPAMVAADLLIADALSCYELHGDLNGDVQ